MCKNYFSWNCTRFDTITIDADNFSNLDRLVLLTVYYDYGHLLKYLNSEKLNMLTLLPWILINFDFQWHPIEFKYQIVGSNFVCCNCWKNLYVVVSEEVYQFQWNMGSNVSLTRFLWWLKSERMALIDQFVAICPYF